VLRARGALAAARTRDRRPACALTAAAAAQYNGASLAPMPGMRLVLPAPAVAIEFAPQQARDVRRSRHALLPRCASRRRLRHACTRRVRCLPLRATRCACGASTTARAAEARSLLRATAAPPCAGCVPPEGSRAHRHAAVLTSSSPPRAARERRVVRAIYVRRVVCERAAPGGGLRGRLGDAVEPRGASARGARRWAARG
jgi:hypothetical protein